MARRVLVTRPEPDDAVTAARLEAMGLAALRLPLTRIAALIPPAVPEATDYEALAVTSANALRHAPAALATAFAGKPCYAVGERTAAEARNIRYTRVTAGPGDAGGLARLIARREPPGARILHPCGRVRTDTLTDALRRAGFPVDALETYDTLPVDHRPEAVAALVGREPVWGALVYSASAAALFAELAAHPVLAPLLAETSVFCISARAAAALGGVACRARVADMPSEEALLAMIAAA